MSDWVLKLGRQFGNLAGTCEISYLIPVVFGQSQCWNEWL